MSVLKNLVMLTGRLASDPEVKFIDGVKRIVNINIATSETYYDKDKSKQTITDWHSLSLWNGVADIIIVILLFTKVYQYLMKKLILLKFYFLKVMKMTLGLFPVLLIYLNM